MVRNWKYWLAAAAVLLTVGAGCEQAVQQKSSVEGQIEVPRPEAKTEDKVDADAAVDAAVEESDADASASLEENSDADILNNDSSELNEYGKAYVDTEFR